MTAKDAAFITLFILFIASVLGNAFLLPYYAEGGQTEKDLTQKVTTLQAEKTNLTHEHQQQIDQLEEENEDLQEEINDLESIINQLQNELESKTGTAISYETLVTSLRIRIYDLEADALQLQSDLNECRAQKSRYCGPYYHCDPCYHCPPYYPCSDSVSVSNVSGVFHGHTYDAVIYVYFTHYPCYVLRIFVDILDVHTIQIVGVDWD
ncbi:MAG: hypothetical protein HXS46_12645 [Theionarchaea archaeon]|nr:MAG: hypothetical protein AYK18_08315 [Theionarchaea archaeon DG-70]MBU7011530.1 hypothetical protein [Theionarchaea archaeon]